MAVERIPLTQPINTRDGTLSQDSRSVNCVFEKGDGNKTFVKRPGLINRLQVTAVTPPAQLLSQGLVSFNGTLVAVISNTVYQINVSSYTSATIGSMSASSANSYFTKSPLDANLFFHNTLAGYILTSGGAYSSPTLPTGTYVPGAVFLDAFMFVGTTGNRIYNSAYQDPTTWNVLSYIAFEQTTDTLVGIAKHLNYLVAFGKSTTQFYYDAGTYTTTTTPLAVAQSYTMEVGCASGDSIATTDNTVVWIGTSKSSGRSVYILNGVSPDKVSTNAIDKVLEIDGLTKVTSYVYKFNGHNLYVLTLHSSNLTLVFDINEREWYQWTQYAIASADQPNAGSYVESYFRGCYYAQVNGVPYVMDDDIATIYSFSTTTYQDDTQPIYCRSVTDLRDNGTTHRKFYGRLEVVGDKSVGGTMLVSHTGDDYVTFSNPRTVNLGSSRAQTYLGGADRRRAWQFLCSSNTPLRLIGVEIDFRLGEMDQSQGQGTRG